MDNSRDTDSDVVINTVSWRRCQFLLLWVCLLLPNLLAAAPTNDEIKATYRKVVDRVEPNRLADRYREMVSIGSRIAGSDGEAKTLAYAEKVFRQMGLKNIRRETFDLTIPDPESIGSLTVGGKPISVYPVWPNLVRTSTCDVTGPILYGGGGTLEELSGLPVSGSIVLLEFNSSARWRFAAKLGAKAIVFLEPGESARAEAEGKFAITPLNIPRFYLPLKNAGPVLSAAFAGQQVRLTCNQPWVKRTSANLFADLDGTNPTLAKERVLAVAYADSMSVVPKLAPGAEALSGLATLLELAEVYREKPGPRPMTFAVFGAHGMALSGAREYVAKRMAQKDEPVLLAATLDLSSGSRTLGAYCQGFFYDYRWETRWQVNNLTRLLRSHADRLKDVFGVPDAKQVLIDAANDGDNRPWKNNIPARTAFDCEPLKIAGINALTFATIEDSRERFDTPFDTFDKVDLPNVIRQCQYLAGFFHHLVNDTSRAGEASDHRVPLTPQGSSAMSLTGGFGTVEGRVVKYDPQQSYLADVSIPESLAVAMHRDKTLVGVRGPMVQATLGKESKYRFVGLAPVSAYWKQWTRPVQLAAFRIDPKSGDVDHAPDYGYASDYDTTFMLKSGYKSISLVVFPCIGIDLYDLVDPQDLQVLTFARVLDAETDSNPKSFGIFRPVETGRLGSDADDTAVLYLPPGQRFKLLMGTGIGEIRLILSNSTPKSEGGLGYVARGASAKDGSKPVEDERSHIADSGIFPDTALNAAKDITEINQIRINRFQSYRILSAGVTDIQSKVRAEIAAAEESKSKLQWAMAERHARAAWGYALRVHPVVQKTANDVVNGVVFYLFLLIPFSYFLERLIFASRSMSRQILIGFGIFIVTFLLLRFIHPAFEIVGNPSMIFIGFVMGALSLIVIAFILGKFEASLKTLKQAQSGVKEVDVQRVSVALAAFGLGVGNMRRRKARTILTTLTLVVMTFIVLSFTSIVSEIRLNELPSDHVPTYSGIQMRNANLDPMEDATYRQIKNEFSGTGVVVRRTYDFGAEVRDNGVLTLQRADKVAEVRAILGLDPEEVQVTRPQQALLPGGRWFTPEDRRAIILPSPVADLLKVSPEEVGRAKVRYAGIDYTVVGILDSAVLRSITDLDGDGILPPDMSLTRQFQQDTKSGNQAFRSFIRLDPAQVAILPAQTALDLGGRLRTLAAGFETPAETRQALDALMPRLRLNLYASVPVDGADATRKQIGDDFDPTGLQVRQFSVFQSSKGTGLILILVQMAIAAVFVFTTMIASVYERTKEISIFSSIGLAPNHIAMLFFAESLVYGVLGAVFGYIAAQVVARIVIVSGAFPGLYLNFSSTSAVLSAGLVMAIVIASTIYPARRATEIAAPAMNEDAFELEADGDEVEVQLPFLISQGESGPLMAFLAEWLRAYEEYTIGDFVTSGTRFRGSRSGSDVNYEVTSTAWLAPYDLGISQGFALRTESAGVPGVVEMILSIHRLAGDPENWMPVNKRFLANLRKQLLTWRTIDEEGRERYRAMATAVLEIPSEPGRTPTPGPIAAT